MKSKDTKNHLPVRNVSLRSLLSQAKRIKETVRQAASGLTSVNRILKRGNKANIPVQTIQAAIQQNEDIEHTVAKAADDLNQVNADLAREVAERVVIETELADTKTSLAEVRDDLSVSQANEEEARNIALQDTLTGIPNRVLFEQSLEHGLIQARRHNWGLAVLFIDIDNFKSINDTYGHDVGDKALLMVAERLQGILRAEDMVSRWGGDEFVCLLLEVKHETDVTRLAEKMAARIADPWEENGVHLSIDASIGIAVYPADGETADVLIKNADTAMYQGKGIEKKVVLFSKTAPRFVTDANR